MLRWVAVRPLGGALPRPAPPRTVRTMVAIVGLAVACPTPSLDSSTHDAFPTRPTPLPVPVQAIADALKAYFNLSASQVALLGVLPGSVAVEFEVSWPSDTNSSLVDAQVQAFSVQGVANMTLLIPPPLAAKLGIARVVSISSNGLQGSASQPPPPAKGGGLEGGALGGVIGGVVGGMLLVAAIVLAVVLARKKSRRQQHQQGSGVGGATATHPDVPATAFTTLHQRLSLPPLPLPRHQQQEQSQDGVLAMSPVAAAAPDRTGGGLPKGTSSPAPAPQAGPSGGALPLTHFPVFSDVSHPHTEHAPTTPNSPAAHSEGYGADGSPSRHPGGALAAGVGGSASKGPRLPLVGRLVSYLPGSIRLAASRRNSAYSTAPSSPRSGSVLPSTPVTSLTARQHGADDAV